eukprot:SAG11_NODE_1173_length_5602_cov_35.121933_8_plen_26_part_01
MTLMLTLWRSVVRCVCGMCSVGAAPC